MSHAFSRISLFIRFLSEQRAEISKLQKENAKLREKVKKLSKENHAATKSYTVKDGKCPFCLQEMPKNKKT